MVALSFLVGEFPTSLPHNHTPLASNCLSVFPAWLMSRFVLHHFGPPTIVIIYSRNTSTAFLPNTRDSRRPNPSICYASPQPFLTLELLTNMRTQSRSCRGVPIHSTFTHESIRWCAGSGPGFKNVRGARFLPVWVSFGWSLLSATHDPSKLASYLSPSLGVEGMYQYLIR